MAPWRSWRRHHRLTSDDVCAARDTQGTLCFILPEEKAFSTYYGITAKSI